MHISTRTDCQPGIIRTPLAPGDKGYVPGVVAQEVTFRDEPPGTGWTCPSCGRRWVACAGGRWRRERPWRRPATPAR